MIDFDRCRRCGRCVLGCPYGAKWDSRRFLDDARAKGARLVTGSQRPQGGDPRRAGRRRAGAGRGAHGLLSGRPGGPVRRRPGHAGHPGALRHPLRAAAVRRPRAVRGRPLAGKPPAPRGADALRGPAPGLHHLPVLRLPELPLRPALAPAGRPGAGPDDQAGRLRERPRARPRRRTGQAPHGGGPPPAGRGGGAVPRHPGALRGRPGGASSSARSTPVTPGGCSPSRPRMRRACTLPACRPTCTWPTPPSFRARWATRPSSPSWPWPGGWLGRRVRPWRRKRPREGRRRREWRPPPRRRLARFTAPRGGPRGSARRARGGR